MTSVRFFAEVQPDKMTLSARMYLALTAAYCWALAFVCLYLPTRLMTSVSFVSVRRDIPGGFTGWGVVHILLGVLATYAAVRGRERPAWFTLIFAAAVVGAWAWGFWYAEFFAGVAPSKKGSPTGIVSYTFVTCVHLIFARQPLRSPFETLVRALDRDA